MKPPNDNRAWWQTALTSAVVSAVVSVVIFLVFGATGNIFTSSPTTMNQTAATGMLFSSTTTSSAVVDVAAKANPSVVSIVISRNIPVIERQFRSGPFGLQIPHERQLELRQEAVGGGSGFFISEAGLIVTNRHVVSNPEASYTAFTNSGESFELEVVDRDPFLDIAIMKTKSGGNFQPLTFADSDNLQLGQTVVAIGNALGELRNSVSVGVVSGVSRSVIAGDITTGLERLDKVIQTDAAVNFGNSGGPLLNLAGEVVGVNVAIASDSQNISFALPANEVKQVVDSVVEYGEIVRPFLGVRYADLTEVVAEEYDIPVDNGALILEGPIGQPAITPGSPAEQAGLQSGDIIVSINGEEVTPDRSLAQIIRNHTVGDRVSVVFLRDGERLEVRTNLSRAPEEMEL